ncbi:MAG: gamma-glutamyl-gamma-aminobutyrate hydrolase family protein [Nocardioidaceae bacterium]|nr:gamma-glutamyl-gamma-aminobutyrate hydrolase family protein [Nocardioidaceae bacterium]
MSAPVIGITCYVEPASWAVWRDVPAVLLPLAYVQQVRAAGGLPLVLPPAPPDPTPSEVAALLDRLDGLIIAGGADVEPARYGGVLHPYAQPARPDRDGTELALARLAHERDLPVLGVCRGMQVMAVAAGGRLEAHLPDRLGVDTHSPGPGVYGTHGVRVAPDSLLGTVLGEHVNVSSYHHQGVLEHPGLVATAWADDGVLEAFEDPTARFRVGVQWHPEVGADPRLFKALVAASAIHPA